MLPFQRNKSCSLALVGQITVESRAALWNAFPSHGARKLFVPSPQSFAIENIPGRGLLTGNQNETHSPLKMWVKVRVTEPRVSRIAALASALSRLSENTSFSQKQGRQ